MHYLKVLVMPGRECTTCPHLRLPTTAAAAASQEGVIIPQRWQSKGGLRQRGVSAAGFADLWELSIDWTHACLCLCVRVLSCHVLSSR